MLSLERDPLIHRLYVGSLAAIVVAVTIYLAWVGYDYYSLPLEERFYHDQYNWFKPSGLLGQGLGVIGTLMILFGVGIYIARKRYGFMSSWVRLKHLLEFHIFLCTLGPILILFHTTFKFGGIVSIAFWSMVAVVASGVIGRFLYLQIPRSIEGRALSLQEATTLRDELLEELVERRGLQHEDLAQLQASSKGLLGDWKAKRQLKRLLHQRNLESTEIRQILDMAKRQRKIAGRLGRLEQAQRFFGYWHVAHLPFALIMLVIVTIHVLVTVALGYRWIF